MNFALWATSKKWIKHEMGEVHSTRVEYYFKVWVVWLVPFIIIIIIITL